MADSKMVYPPSFLLLANQEQRTTSKVNSLGVPRLEIWNSSCEHDGVGFFPHFDVRLRHAFCTGRCVRFERTPLGHAPPAGGGV